MINYKKILKTEESRFKILRLLNFIPDKLMIKIQYFIKCSRKLNLKNPERFSEKIQWYKLNYRKPIMSRCVDKYYVRKYIENKKLDLKLTKLYGRWTNVEEINFNNLPDSFVLKVTNGSGTNILVKNKENIDIKKIKLQLKVWQKRSNISPGREWAYYNSNSDIIAEEFLMTEDGDLPDYKFLCFNGKVEYIIYDYNRFNGHKRFIYDRNWKDLKIYGDDAKYISGENKAPQNLLKMIEVAEKLSTDFPFIRVDLYSIKNEIYFGELTFYPWSGYVQFTPDKFDFELGEKFKLMI